MSKTCYLIVTIDFENITNINIFITIVYLYLCILKFYEIL